MSAPPSTDDARATVLAAAERELHSAQLLAADPLAGPPAAAPHLRALWRCLAQLSRGEVPDGPGRGLSDWLAADALAELPARLHEPLFASLVAADAHDDPAASSAPLPGPPQLLTELRALRRLLRALTDPAHARRVRLRWIARGLAALVVVLAAGALIWRPWQRGPSGPWRAAFYPSKSFDGRPDLTSVRALDFDWGQDPPTESIPSDFYSARFDTCLVLDQATSVAFMLVSDNGSRLFIDGAVEIDNWAKRRAVSVEGARVELDAGVHHLRVEYFEDRNEAQLHLSASFDPSEPPSPIPAARLRAPAGPLDGEAADPCAGVND